MEKFTKELEPKLNSIFSDTSFCIKEAWKKEVEKFNEAEKSLGLQNIKLEKTIACLNNVMVTQKMKLEDQAKTINSLQDKNQAQTLEIDFIHKKLEGQQLQIDILEAEKKSLDARFNEVNLKLKQQRQVSNGEIPPLIPDQVEDKVKKGRNPSTPSENETEPKIPSFDQEQKRYACTGCLHNWYHHKPLRAPGTFVKTFGSVHRLRIHAYEHKHLMHQTQENRHVISSRMSECDSHCIKTGELRIFDCTARIDDDWICHQKFHCRLHYDRHIEIDHANIKALDKYSLAKLYEKYFKK